MALRTPDKPSSLTVCQDRADFTPARIGHTSLLPFARRGVPQTKRGVCLWEERHTAPLLLHCRCYACISGGCSGRLQGGRSRCPGASAFLRSCQPQRCMQRRLTASALQTVYCQTSPCQMSCGCQRHPVAACRTACQQTLVPMQQPTSRQCTSQKAAARLLPRMGGHAEPRQQLLLRRQHMISLQWWCIRVARSLGTTPHSGASTRCT